MFNKKLHILVFIVLVSLGTTLTFDGTTYGIVYYLGIKDVMFFRLFTAFSLIVLISFVISNYIKINHIFYINMSKGDYDGAKKLLDKYCKQNQSLFLSNQLFYSFAVGEQKTIDILVTKYCKKEYIGRKSIDCYTYKYLSLFMVNKRDNIDAGKLINVLEKRKKKNDNLVYLLKSINCLNQKEYENSLEWVNKFSSEYNYPCIVNVIDKIKEDVLEFSSTNILRLKTQ